MPWLSVMFAWDNFSPGLKHFYYSFVIATVDLLIFFWNKCWIQDMVVRFIQKKKKKNLAAEHWNEPSELLAPLTNQMKNCKTSHHPDWKQSMHLFSHPLAEPLWHIKSYSSYNLIWVISLDQPSKQVNRPTEVWREQQNIVADVIKYFL